MLPNHPNLLLEQVLSQLSDRLLSEQQRQFEAFKAQYKQDTQSLTQLVNSLSVAIEQLETSLISEPSSSPTPNTPVNALLTQVEQLARRVTQLTQQYQHYQLDQEKHSEQLWQELGEQTCFTQELMESNEQLQRQVQALMAVNQQLQQQNETLLAKLSDWIDVYQQQERLLQSCVRQERFMIDDGQSFSNVKRSEN